MYWLSSDPEVQYESPSEMLSEECIHPLPGEQFQFLTAYRLPEEVWVAVAVDFKGNPCPKCGGRQACEDFLGEDCGAEKTILVKLDN
jgi:hypothetical protein